MSSHLHVRVCLQYTTSVYWGSRAGLVGSVSAPPSGVTVLWTVLMERMKLSAVRYPHQHPVFQTCGCAFVHHITEQHGGWVAMFSLFHSSPPWDQLHPRKLLS